MKRHLKMTLVVEINAPTEEEIVELGERLAIKLPYIITDDVNYHLAMKNLQYKFFDF